MDGTDQQASVHSLASCLDYGMQMHAMDADRRSIAQRGSQSAIWAVPIALLLMRILDHSVSVEPHIRSVSTQ